MNNLDYIDRKKMDFKKLYPYIIEAFTKVYGSEFKSLIEERLNNLLIIYYQDIDGLRSYISYLKKCNEEKKLEFQDLNKELLPYEDIVKSENKRLDSIYQKYKKLLYKRIYDKLPLIIKNKLSSKTLEEQITSLLGPYYLKTLIESFDSKIMDYIESPNNNLISKKYYLFDQACYLKKMGIDIDEYKMINLNQEMLDDYFKLIENKEVKEIIPSQELIDYVNELRERYIEDTVEEFITTQEDFKEAISTFPNNEKNQDFILEQIRNKTVCTTCCSNIAVNCNKIVFSIIPIIFYTIRSGDSGILFYTFMHEICHSIDILDNISGFDLISKDRNPYDERYRKYERFNEIINDIFTTEAIDYLYNLDIYLIEPKEIVRQDYYNVNTCIYSRKLLYPLIAKYRDIVIEAKVISRPQILTNCIGEDNYEELVDIVNKVDYLMDKGLFKQLYYNEEIDESLEEEYKRELIRLDKVYQNIDLYNQNKLSKNYSVK